MLISRLPNPNILQQSEPNGLKLWIITVNWGIKMLDFCQILKWPVSKSYWKLVLFFENNDIIFFYFISTIMRQMLELTFEDV